MSVHGTISQDELQAALALERAGRRRGFLVVAGVAFVGGALLAARGLAGLGVVFLALGIGLLLSEFISARVILPWRARGLYREGSPFRLPGEYAWTATHFQARNEKSDATIPWTDIRDVIENDRVFLVRHHGGRLQIVPKSWFDAGTLASFREAAGARLARKGAR